MPVIASALMGLLLFSGIAAAQAGGDTPAAPAGFSATLTAYNAVSGQTDDTPTITADGGPANPAVVAARSRDLAAELPFGTIIAIDAPLATSTTCGFAGVGPSIGYRVITDTMNARYQDHVDVLLSTKDRVALPDGGSLNAANALGVCPGVIVRIVGFIDLAHNPLPETQAALAALIKGSATSLALR